MDRANLEAWSSLTPFFCGRIGIEWLKIKIKILTIMHAWCEYTHDHEMNENNEIMKREEL